MNKGLLVNQAGGGFNEASLGRVHINRNVRVQASTGNGFFHFSEMQMSRTSIFIV